MPKVVLLSSANVYGPRPDNPQFLTEDAPLLAAQRFPQMRDLVEIDHLVSTFLWRARDVETVILRPVHIVGPVHNAPSNYLRIDRTAACCSASIRWCSSIHVAGRRRGDRARARARPARHLQHVGPGEVPLSAILRELGRDPRSIPHPLAKPILPAGVRARAVEFPVAELDFIRYVCMVDGRRAAAELGFRPRFGLRETIRAVDDSA